MEFTKFGKELSAKEKLPTFDKGAEGHAQAMAYNARKKIVLTGRGDDGKPIRMEAKSIFAAWATMQAAWGLRRAYLFDAKGRRRLIIKR